MREIIRNWLSEPIVIQIIAASIAMAVILGVSYFARRWIAHYVETSDTRYRLRKFISFAGYFLVLLILSIIFSNRLGGLTVALGVASAGIAFALQEVITSFAGWFAITFAGFYDPGDRVEVGGIKGDVIDINFLRTTLMEMGEWVGGDQYTGRIVLVANSFVFKAPVFNYSGNFPFLWDEIKIPVKYGSDHRLAKMIIESIAEEIVGEYTRGAEDTWGEFASTYLLEHAATDPAVSLVANDNWLEFTLRYIVSYKERRSTRTEIFTRILDEFEKTDGKVGFASATFQLVEAPPIRVSLSDERE